MGIAIQMLHRGSYYYNRDSRDYLVYGELSHSYGVTVKIELKNRVRSSYIYG